MTRTTIPFLALAAFAAFAPAPASAAMSEADAHAILFRSQDANGDGLISVRESEAFRRAAFAAMDANSDGKVERPEWLSFDPGFLGISNERGVVMALDDAKGSVFDRYDGNGDGALSDDEMAASILRDFLAADANDDGLDMGEMPNLPILAASTDALMK